MITNCIHLDFNKENDLKVPSVQYDSGSRFVKIKLQRNKSPFEIDGYRVTVVANKVDGTEIMNDCTILDGVNGVVQFEITEQFNAVEGVVDCQLKLFKGKTLLTSMPFSINVVKSVSTKEIVSSNELKTLVNALGEVQDIDNRFAQTNAQLSLVEDKTTNYYNADRFDGVSDTEKLKNAIAKCYSDGGGVVVCTKNSYQIDSYINIPCGVSFDGNFATFTPSSSYKGFMFGLNSENGETWDIAYPNLYKGFFKNVKFESKTGAEGHKGVFSCCKYSIENVESLGMEQTIVYGNHYLDSRVITNISIERAVGDNYQIFANSVGDGLYFNNVHGRASKLLRMYGCNGGKLTSCILNGGVSIESCSALALESIHMEGGVIELVNSSCELNNVFAWKKSGVSPIKITSTYGVGKPTKLSNVKIIYPMYTDINADGIDISMTGDMPVHFCNVFKSYEPSGRVGSSFEFGVRTNVEVFNANSAMCSISSIVIPASNKIIDTLNNNYNTYGSYDRYFIDKVLTTTDNDNTNMKWDKTGGTYYYIADMLFDGTRMLGIKGQNLEKSVTVNPTEVVMFQLQAYNHLVGKMLRIYRGTTSNAYSEYVDIPLCSFGDYLKYDKGSSISNIFGWKQNIGNDRKTINTCHKYELNGENVIAHCDNKPSVGSWKKGDKIINTLPSGGAYEGWVCVESGTPGVWKGYGIIEN